MSGDHWLIGGRNAEHKRDQLIKHIKQIPIGEFGYIVKILKGKRTSKQRNAMEVYFRLVAEDLAARGFDMREVCTLPIEPTQANVKENIWKKIQKAMTGKRSTTELERDEVGKVYMQMSKILAEKFDCTVPFPDRLNPPEYQ